MKPICVAYHCLFQFPDKPLPQAEGIVGEQMEQLRVSGLLNACSEFIVGINGGPESHAIAARIIPQRAKITWHGLESRAENLTLCLMHDWAKAHPGWYCLYHQAKSVTHDPESDYGMFATRWRRCMARRCVTEWRTAVALLGQGYEAVGCHWLTGQGHDKSQHFFAGNFYWVTSDFLATIPSMYERERIKVSGISNIESRYEAEVHLGNGPRLPKIKDLEMGHGLGGCP